MSLIHPEKKAPRSAWAALRGRAGRTLLSDERLHPFNNRADGIEIGGLLIRIVRYLDSERVFDVENDNGKIERLNLEVAELGVQRDRLWRFLHVLLEDRDNLVGNFVHSLLPALSQQGPNLRRLRMRSGSLANFHLAPKSARVQGLPPGLSAF